MKHYLVPQLSTTDFLHYGADAMQQAWYLEHAALCPAYRNTETTYYPHRGGLFPRLSPGTGPGQGIYLPGVLHHRRGLHVVGGAGDSDGKGRRRGGGAGDLRRRGLRPHPAFGLPPAAGPEGHPLPGVPALPPPAVHPPEQPGPPEDLRHRRGHRLRQRPEPGRRIRGPEGALRLLEGQCPLPPGEAVWSLAVFFLTMWNHQNPHTDFSPSGPRPCPR